MATKTTTTAKAATKPEVKAETKAPAKKAEAKKVEAKKVEAKVETKVEAKAETKAAEKKPATKKAETKKTETKKTETKKAETKTTTKKAATKKATTAKAEDVFVQFYGMEVNTATVLEAAKADYAAKSGKKTTKNVQIYIKPEDNTAYYVIDGVEGSISL